MPDHQLDDQALIFSREEPSQERDELRGAAPFFMGENKSIHTEFFSLFRL